MATLSVTTTPPEGESETLSGDALASPVKRRINQAREDRKRLEPVWQSNLAFAAGKFWLQWDRDRRQLMMPPELFNKELYTADVITEYRTTALGELSSDDDRPELLLRRDDEASEDFQSQLNKAVGFGWDHEWNGDEALETARRLCIDLGTSAIQCHFDPTVGNVVGDVPHFQGKPVYDQKQLYGDAENPGLMSAGPSEEVQMKSVRSGRICWRPLSPFNLLVPPGIPDESSFPWECVVRPVPLADVKAQYGPTAADLKEDGDIGSLLGLDSNSEMSVASTIGATSGTKVGRVRDHVWLFTYYEKPTDKYPEGRTVTLASNQMKLLEVDPHLPYQAPDGSWRSGIAYFHWWRVTGRFYSRALVEVMKDAQRNINKHRTQMTEIIDRGLPYVLIEEGSGMEKRKGLPVEVIPIKKQGTGVPQISPGIGPGGWMQQQIEAIREDLEHATGIHGPRVGLNPANVTTYSQLALISENDQTKREHIYRSHKTSIARLVEDSVYDMRTYWGPQRQIDLAGDDNRVDAMIFDSTKIPAFFMVKVARGTAKPRTQAAELTKVEQLWHAAVESGIVQADPQGWHDWYKDSLDAGQAVETPKANADAQSHKAQVENHLLFEGQEVPVAYYDPPETHIPIHRQAQIQAQMSGDQMADQRIEQHIQMHEQAAQQNAMQLGQQFPAVPGAPPIQAPQQQQDNQLQEQQKLQQSQQQHEQKMTHAEEQHQQRLTQAQQQQRASTSGRSNQ
jgi:hypothetical protein